MTFLILVNLFLLQPLSGDYVVRLRGLPWAATAQDVVWLLKDCRVLNGDKGVHFTFATDGRPSGEAFVELGGEEDVSKALAHSHEHMGKRYVEIFRASRGQMEWDCRMEEKVGGGSGSGGVVRLRGLPFKCEEVDVRKFFSGLEKGQLVPRVCCTLLNKGPWVGRW